jgi:tetratricopeptide (TPR) repeat protein
VPVKEIAGELFHSEQTAGAQLKSLKDKGYVTAGSVGRESRYDLAEPLMRMCVEVKNPQREPIRLIVEFLRVWYDRKRFDSLCNRYDRDGDLGKYIDAVLRDYKREEMGPIEAALVHDLESAEQTGDSTEIVRIAQEIVATSGFQLCLLAGWKLKALNRMSEALEAFTRACDLAPEDSIGWYFQSVVLRTLGRNKEGLQALEHATQVDPTNVNLWGLKGVYLEESNWHEEALEAFEQASKLDPKNAGIWNNQAFVLNALGRHAEAVGACNRAIELDGTNSYAWYNLGRAKLGLGRVREALDDLRRTIELNGDLSNAFEAMAEAHAVAGNWDEAERVLAERFQLPRSLHNTERSWHLPDVILAIFRASADHVLWGYRVGRLAAIAADEKSRHAPADLRPNPLAQLGHSLVVSLTRTAYAEAAADTLDGWAGVWREVANRHPDLSLATRVFGVGLRYLRSKDERVLLDLVREERSILRNLFRLDDGADEG